MTAAFNAAKNKGSQADEHLGTFQQELRDLKEEHSLKVSQIYLFYLFVYIFISIYLFIVNSIILTCTGIITCIISRLLL